MFGPKRTLVEAWYANEGAGTTTRGALGKSNGTLTGAVAWVNGLHNNAFGFVNGTERVNFNNETLFDFMEYNSTFTISVVYRITNGANSVPNGKFVAKQANNTGGVGWHLIATTDIVGDFAFNCRDSVDTSKLITTFVPASRSGGNRWHVLTFDYACRRAAMTSALDAKMNLDGQNLSLSLSNISDTTILNDAGVSAGNIDNGAGGGANFAVEMIAIWDGSGHPALTDAEMALPFSYAFGN